MKYTATLKRIERRGEIAFLPPDDLGVQERIRQILRRCKDKHADYVKLTFEPPYKPRTTGKKSQCNRINGFIMQICDYTGYDFADMKMYCKMKAITRGYPVMKDADGEPIISMITGDPMPESEKYINTFEAGILSEVIEQVAAEAGVPLKEE